MKNTILLYVISWIIHRQSVVGTVTSEPGTAYGMYVRTVTPMNGTTGSIASIPAIQRVGHRPSRSVGEIVVRAYFLHGARLPLVVPSGYAPPSPRPGEQKKYVEVTKNNVLPVELYCRALQRLVQARNEQAAQSSFLSHTRRTCMYAVHVRPVGHHLFFDSVVCVRGGGGISTTVRYSVVVLLCKVFFSVWCIINMMICLVA